MNRILMNLHPSVLAHAAFLDRPHTKRQLLDAIAMVEEKLFVLKERSRSQPQMKESGGGASRNIEPTRKVPVRPGRLDVGIAGVLAILRGSAAGKVSHRETGGRPEGVRPPGGSTECRA